MHVTVITTLPGDDCRLLTEISFSIKLMKYLDLSETKIILDLKMLHHLSKNCDTIYLFFPQRFYTLNRNPLEAFKLTKVNYFYAVCSLTYLQFQSCFLLMFIFIWLLILPVLKLWCMTEAFKIIPVSSFLTDVFFFCSVSF